MDIRQADQILERLATARPAAVCWSREQSGIVAELLPGAEAANARPSAILSGSFNPLHDGHRRMRELAASWLELPVEYELSVRNADKPDASATDLCRRLACFESTDLIWLSNLPTFAEKSTLLSPMWFVVGMDTLERIAQPKFYGDDEAARDRVFAGWNAAGVRFLVFGRVKEGRFLTPSTSQLPESLGIICKEVPQVQFEMDISSSQLRETGQW